MEMAEQAAIAECGTVAEVLGTPEALRRLAEARDPEAWAALLQRHGPEMLRLAQRITNDAALAEDVCQETLLQIRRYAGRFRPPSDRDSQAAARTWIMRITYHVALRLLRTRRRTARREASPEATARGLAACGGPAERAVSHEEAQVLRDELAELPESLRHAVMLHYYGELDYDELAGALDCTPENARQRVHRGVERLRRRLAALGIVVLAAELPAVLAGTTVQAAEAAGIAALEAGRLTVWQALLNSPAAPTLSGVVPATTLPPVLKFALAATGALLALGLALTCWSILGRESGASKPTVVVAKAGSATEPAAGWRYHGEALGMPFSFVGTPPDMRAREDRLARYLETRRVSFEFDDTTFDDAVGYARAVLAEEFTDAEIQISPDLAEQPVHGMKATDAPLGKALDQMAAAVNAKVVRLGSTLRVVPAAGETLRKSPREF
jgi:RNA polymerase sigma-70 factor (ECF subfamily)